MTWALFAAGILVLALPALAWWQRPRWLLWFEHPRLSRSERRCQRRRTAVSNARETLLAGYAHDALWWARRARSIDAQDPQALAALAAVMSYKGRYEAAIKHWRLALHIAQDSGLATINSEEWSHEALDHATVLLTLADEDPSHRDALRQEATEWLHFALTNHPDCRMEMNPRLQRLATSDEEWLRP